jgi:hypothetical protein
MDESFPTFFHINQRGEAGYRDLARLTAMSHPLILWAPSSVLLRSESPGIDPRLFLELLEEGRVRVMGRHSWLTDPHCRDSYRWPGTAWDSQIDGQIQRVAEEDENKVLAERRVIIAPEEEGYTWADEYLSQYPEESLKWYRRTRRKDASKTIPGGTLEAVQVLGTDHVTVARRILRDAFNHGRALLESQARVPILQSFTHRRFIELLAKAPPVEGESRQPPARRVSKEPTLEGLSAMTGELAQVLGQLDLQRGPDPKRLRRFLRGSGHRQLVAWMSEMCTEYERHRQQIVDGVILDRLEQELGRASVEGITQGIRNNPDEKGVGAVGVVGTIVGAATGGIGVAAALCIGASVYLAGKGLARELGYAPSAFDGPQWPFLYTYGSRARKGQLEKVRGALAQLPSRRASQKTGA